MMDNADTQPPTWLAVAGPADYVRLVPVAAIGPDVFVKWTDWRAATDEVIQLRAEISRLTDALVDATGERGGG